MSTSKIAVNDLVDVKPAVTNILTADAIIKMHVENGIKKMKNGELYTLKQILSLTIEGSLYWNLKMGLHTSIGLVVAEMVRINLLPITFAGKTSCNKNLYKLL
jgi:hypothetical protein